MAFFKLSDWREMSVNLYGESSKATQWVDSQIKKSGANAMLIGSIELMKKRLEEVQNGQLIPTADMHWDGKELHVDLENVDV